MGFIETFPGVAGSERRGASILHASRCLLSAIFRLLLLLRHICPSTRLFSSRATRWRKTRNFSGSIQAGKVLETLLLPEAEPDRLVKRHGQKHENKHELSGAVSQQSLGPFSAPERKNISSAGARFLPSRKRDFLINWFSADLLEQWRQQRRARGGSDTRCFVFVSPSRDPFGSSDLHVSPITAHLRLHRR